MLLCSTNSGSTLLPSGLATRISKASFPRKYPSESYILFRPSIARDSVFSSTISAACAVAGRAFHTAPLRSVRSAIVRFKTQLSSFNLHINEGEAVSDAKRREHYCIYIVTNAHSVARIIERLRNPTSYVEGKRLSCEAIVYELQLSQPSGRGNSW